MDVSHFCQRTSALVSYMIKDAVNLNLARARNAIFNEKEKQCADR